MKLLRRVLSAAALLVAALVVFLFGSIFVDGLLGGGRLDAVTNTRIPNAGGPEIRAYVAKPATPGPHPAVIMIHEFWGLNEDIRQKADLLAESGYVVVAPDMFRGSSTGWIPRAIYQVVTTPVEQINADAGAVFDWLAAQPEVRADRIASLGFCFGGRTSMLFSLQQPKLAGTVIFYGSPVTDAERLRALPGPVLGIFGGADDSIPLDEVRAFEAGLEQAGVPHTISIYDEQPHAFVSSVEGIRAGGAQGEAWNEMLQFLEETLKRGASAQRAPAALVRANDFIGWDYLWALAWLHAGAGHSH
jgi:carboxymethylenebutenolidase